MRVETERFTKFDRTNAELQLLLFFSIAVAGKNASITERAVARFFAGVDLTLTPPYELIKNRIKAGTFRFYLEHSRLGKYDAIMKSAAYIIETGLYERLDTCTLEELVAIPYCGLKTARMILLHSRPNQRVIPLDTHILKLLRDELHIPNVPFSTPGSKEHPEKYLALEREFFKYVERWEKLKLKQFKLGGEIIKLDYYDDGTLNVANFDLSVWKCYRVNTKERAK